MKNSWNWLNGKFKVWKIFCIFFLWENLISLVDLKHKSKFFRLFHLSELMYTLSRKIIWKFIYLIIPLFNWSAEGYCQPISVNFKICGMTGGKRGTYYNDNFILTSKKYHHMFIKSGTNHWPENIDLSFYRP